MPESQEPNAENPREIIAGASEESLLHETELTASPELKEETAVADEPVTAEGEAILDEPVAVAAEVQLTKNEKQAFKKTKKQRFFDPHETVRADSLAGAPLATFKQRFIAYAIDFIIVGTFSALALALITYLIIDVWHVPGTFLHVTQGPVKMEGKLEMDKTNDFIEALSVLIYFGLSVWLTNGLTLGKRIMRIRIVSLTHERITLWQSCERALGYGASALEAGFGFFQFFIYKNRTCVHDRIAETIVVQEVRIKEPSVKKEKSQAKK
jgi:uncharacterized RDD family membrane protein YckC